MSRRRGEFEHRTSIFEGAFRAWSYLGGLEPVELESKTLTELDPLTPEAESRARTDPRLRNADQQQVQQMNDGDGPDGRRPYRRIYPYEPLPRSGLAHPFVQAILSPWLGPEAEQNAIQLGLTTLRTWWQHRRKGESGSAISALGTDKMRGVVEGYTRHFFSLAYCLVTNDGEQPPRTLHTKMKELEKSRAKKHKKRAREEEAGKLAALALNAGLAHGLNASGVGGSSHGGKGSSEEGNGAQSASGNSLDPQMQMGGMSAGSVEGMGHNGGMDEHLSPLERLALAHQRQQHAQNPMQAGQPPIKTPHSGIITLKGKCVPGKLDMEQLQLQITSHSTQMMHSGGLNRGDSTRSTNSVGGIVTPDVMNSASNLTLGNQSQTFGSQQQSGMGMGSAPGYRSSSPQEDDPNPGMTPVVLISPKGDIQIAMSVDGITCAHCVKIVETVLRGCNGNKSPINGLLDAAADHELCSVIIKIDKSSNAKRIARESARNLAMVGYTAKVKEMRVPSSGGADSGKSMEMLFHAFDVVASHDPMEVFDWNIACTCPDNGVLRQDCTRHSQMKTRIFQAFERRQAQVTEFMTGCGKKYGGECTCGGNCQCKAGSGCCSKDERAGMAAATGGSQQPQNALTHAVGAQQSCCNSQQAAHGGGHGHSHQQGTGASAMELSQAQISEQLTAAAAAAAGAAGRAGRDSRGNSVNSVSSMGRTRMSGHSETFGRAMSGLSQLSIDWENMDDFDVTVDHSAHINNDYENRAGGKLGPVHDDEDVTDGIMEGCAMLSGGECNCGPTCFCVGCPIHDKPNLPMNGHDHFLSLANAGAIRRSSSLRRKGVPAEVGQVGQANMQVSFNL